MLTRRHLLGVMGAAALLAVAGLVARPPPGAAAPPSDGDLAADAAVDVVLGIAAETRRAPQLQPGGGHHEPPPTAALIRDSPHSPASPSAANSTTASTASSTVVHEGGGDFVGLDPPEPTWPAGEMADGFTVLPGAWPDQAPDSNRTQVRALYFYNVIVQLALRRVTAVALLRSGTFPGGRDCQVSLDGGRSWSAPEMPHVVTLRDYLDYGTATFGCPLPAAAAAAAAAGDPAGGDGPDVRLRLVVTQDCLYRVERRQRGPDAACAVPVDRLEFRHVRAEPALRPPLPLVACVASFHGHVRVARLAAWLAYHRRLGVAHAFLYDMGARFDDEPALAALRRAGLVSLRRLRLPRAGHEHRDRRDLNNALWRGDCLARTQSGAALALFSDVDEFVVLVPPGGYAPAAAGAEMMADTREPAAAAAERNASTGAAEGPQSSAQNPRGTTGTPATTIPALMALYPDAAAVSFGSYQVSLARCVGPAAAADGNATGWADGAWAAPLAYRERAANCKLKTHPRTRCPHFYGHRKYVLRPRVVPGPLQQHTAAPGATEDLDTRVAHLLHYRGLATTERLCDEAADAAAAEALTRAEQPATDAAGQPRAPLAMDLVYDPTLPLSLAAVYAMPLP